MYVLFALLVSLVLYLALFAIGRAIHRPAPAGRLAWRTLALLRAALAVFNLASRAVGLDLGPFRAVRYSIPDDYLARGALGIAALIPYALACFSPLVSLVSFRRGFRGG